MAKRRKPKTEWSADHLVKLLAAKHAQDVFVDECKNGPTWTAGPDGHLRLDAWAMKRSYRHPLAIGYEVKVCRQDFEGDEKWRGYLAYCHEFYFVCPTGLIQAAQLPDDTGLLWMSKTGTRLFRKKKARYRPDVKIPEDFYRYILMSRARIDPRGRPEPGRGDKAAFWREWLEREQDMKDVGWRVSRRLKTLIREQIDTVASKNEILRAENEKLAVVKALVEEMGIPLYQWGYKESVQKKIEDLQKLLPEDFRQNLERAEQAVQAVLAQTAAATASPA